MALTAMYQGAVLQLAVAAGRLSERKYQRITGMNTDEAARHLEALLREAENIVTQAEQMPVPIGVMWGRALQAIEDGRVEIIDPAANNHGRAN